jgi:hypothetical protein
MKKIIGISAFLFCLALAPSADAQEAKTKAKKAGYQMKKGAKKVGNKTAEVASKGKAKVTDEVHKDKVGPNGEVIYIDNHSRYYWVEKQGKRHYVAAEALKNKEG